jgi:hypothetical protein
VSKFHSAILRKLQKHKALVAGGKQPGLLKESFCSKIWSMLTLQ